MVERFNRTLATQLAVLTSQCQCDWDEHIPLDRSTGVHTAEPHRSHVWLQNLYPGGFGVRIATGI